MTKRHTLSVAGLALSALLLLAFVQVLSSWNPVQPAQVIDQGAVQPVLHREVAPPLSKEQKNLVSYLSDKYSTSKQFAERIVRAAYREARQAGISPLLVLAIIEKESSLRPEVRSGYGAVGLMQVVPRFHADKVASSNPSESLKHPETNIRVGTQIVAEYVDGNGGNLKKALRKYSGNARAYAAKVFTFRRQLERAAQQPQET